MRAGLSVIPYLDSLERIRLVFWPIDPTQRQVELFATEVVPLLS
ncbi:MAG TPA: hypothetical protein VKI99_09045 [Candidatus Dormibacteraeota bacterium]|nr:hypothetical protein [Candidatus Dormibacteraeota bacterium]